jgi:excisionase family DNA binding protein
VDVERETYSVLEAARVLGISRSGAYGAVYRGEIPALRIGQRIVVPRKALRELLEHPSMVRQTGSPPPPR